MPQEVAEKHLFQFEIQAKTQERSLFQQLWENTQQ